MTSPWRPVVRVPLAMLAGIARGALTAGRIITLGAGVYWCEVTLGGLAIVATAPPQM